MGYDFGQVLGQLMSSVVTARNISDRASRDIALQYEKDELMRTFPVPFVELENVEIDLKFAFAAQDMRPLPYIKSVESAEEKDLVYATAECVRDRVMETISSKLGSLFTLTEGYDAEKAGQCIQYAVVSVIGDPTLLAVSTNPPEGVTLQSFDVRQVVNKVVYGLMGNGFVSLTKENLLVAIEELVKVLEPVAVEHEQKAVEVRNQMQVKMQMQVLPGEPNPYEEPVPFPSPRPLPDDGLDPVYIPEETMPDPSPFPRPLPDTEVDPAPIPVPNPVPQPSPVPAPDPVPVPDPAPDPLPDPISRPVPFPDPVPIPRPLPVPYRNPMSVMIDANELIHLPVECLSSIKITVGVQNYEWTKVDRKDGVVSRKLVRE